MEQFRLEIANEGKGKFYEIKPLGNSRYEIFDDGQSIGTIALDEQNHAHCESQGCELDMPILNSIREGIQYHEQWNNGQGHM
ncbi:hypothetical protein [Pedobacter steynii]